MNVTMTPPFKQVDDDEEEEEFSRLSFCDLPFSGAATPHRPSDEPDHLFEFSAAAGRRTDIDIVFFGKVIHGGGSDEDDRINEFQKRDYFAAVKSRSLRKPPLHRPDAAAGRRLSASTRFGSGEMAYHAQRVNISSLTTMSAKSRRRMFMFGPVKFKPEMELSAIKQRQGKMAEKTAEKKAPPRKSHWGVVKSSLSWRSHLASFLARSLGCVPAAGDRWELGVAN